MSWIENVVLVFLVVTVSGFVGGKVVLVGEGDFSDDVSDMGLLFRIVDIVVRGIWSW